MACRDAVWPFANGGGRVVVVLVLVLVLVAWEGALRGEEGELPHAANVTVLASTTAPITARLFLSMQRSLAPWNECGAVLHGPTPQHRSQAGAYGQVNLKIGR